MSQSRSVTPVSPRPMSRSRSPRASLRRSISPRSRSRSRSRGSSRLSRGRPNGVRGRPYRSRSGSPMDGPRRYRSRSYTRSISRGRSLSPPRSTKIVVEKLTKNVHEGHLKEIFGAYGPIRELDMPINRQFMTNRGTAYISYNTTVDAEAAISHMHEAQLDGAVIKVSIVLPRRRFSVSPPPAKRSSNFERFEARGPPGGFRGPPGMPGGRGGRYRSPPRRERPPYDRPIGRGRESNTYRPRSYSRSRSASPYSPRRSRSRSVSSRSRSPPPRRRPESNRYDSPVRGGRRRRSPSYSSYSSDSRSRSRGRGPRGRR